MTRAPTGKEVGGAEAAPPALLSRQSPLALFCLCLLILAFVGWAVIRSPLAALPAIAVWGAFMLRRRIGRAAARIPRLGERILSSPGRAAGPDTPEAAGTALIQADLALEGRLAGAMLVEVFGRLSGDVRSDTVRVHPGGELRGRIAQRRIGLAVGAIFEGTAAPLSGTAVDR
ncbi:MAG TPA: polymer-forming cytoskeletal protein [Caulobacteraceae bacterium]|nr:polymer-forming cytoskeletal protein [Caulobacteraceae bacterium]